MEMTVGDLIDHLQKLDRSMLVLTDCSDGLYSVGQVITESVHRNTYRTVSDDFSRDKGGDIQAVVLS